MHTNKPERPVSLSGTGEIMGYLKLYSPKNIGVPKSGVFERKNRIVRKVFKNTRFSGNVHDIEFRSAKFVDCEFDGVWGFYCLFRNTQFKNCIFRNSRFSHLEDDWNGVHFQKCTFRNVEIDEGCVWNMIFDECLMISSRLNGLYPSENILFYDSTIESSNFQDLNYHETKPERDDEFVDMMFSNCIIERTGFHDVNLRNSRIVNTSLLRSTFSNCELDDETIVVTEKLKYRNIASMDYLTIMRSDELREETLIEYFNIADVKGLKRFFEDATNPQPKYSTVFISYSFNDAVFARRINEMLKERGVLTFLWEKDAPGGEPMNEIMSKNVLKHDKVLFIASKSSIRSTACQFELSTARKKQEILWENVFFPVAIDRYLFDVKKENIRPIKLADEYWENIEEIKRVNVLDLSDFVGDDFNLNHLEEQVDKIVSGLKFFD